MAALSIGLLLLIVLGGLLVVGGLIYIVAKQIDRNQHEDFEKRDN